MSTTRLKQDRIEEILSTWLGVCEFIGDAPEEQLLQLLEHERQNRKRGSVLLRIHARLNTTRARRERAELLKEATT